MNYPINRKWSRSRSSVNLMRKLSPDPMKRVRSKSISGYIFLVLLLGTVSFLVSRNRVASSDFGETNNGSKVELSVGLNAGVLSKPVVNPENQVQQKSEAAFLSPPAGMLKAEKNISTPAESTVHQSEQRASSLQGSEKKEAKSSMVEEQDKVDSTPPANGSVSEISTEKIKEGSANLTAVPSPGQARYDIDALSYGKPELYRKESEVFACDRRHWRTDVCIMKGDVRVDARKNLVVLYAKDSKTRRGVESVKAYPRKWELELMSAVNDIVLKSVDAPSDLQPWEPATNEERKMYLRRDGASSNMDRDWKETEMVTKFDRDRKHELGNGSNWSEDAWKVKRTQRLRDFVTQLWFHEEERESVGQKLLDMGGKLETESRHAWITFNVSNYVTKEEMAGEAPTLKCDVRHSVPGVIFSTSGYTGNVYHEFNEGLIPLFITTAHMKGNFVAVIEDMPLWWIMKYENVLRKLSHYPVVLLGKERYVHCFSEVIVGLRVHDELTVYPQLMPMRGGSFVKFQAKLEDAWKDYPYFEPHPEGNLFGCKPLMTLISRKHTRVITNEDELVAMAKNMGFFVRVVQTEKHVPLAVVWKKLQESNLMVGVHGAAMTHFMFMRPNSTYVQILPLGTDWPARTYYGDPAVRLGLQYTEYKVEVEESSLSRVYARNHTALVDPQSYFFQVGWWTFKDVYLENQNVTLNLGRFRKVLEKVKEQVKWDPLYIKHAKKRTFKRCQALY